MCRTRRGSYRRLEMLALLAALAALPSSAAAQDRFDAQRFNPSVSQTSGFFTQPAGRVVEGGRWEVGLLFNYANDPLVLADGNDNRLGSPVSDMVTANLLGVWGFGSVFDIGLDLPLVLYQAGDALPQLPDAQSTDPGAGVGDLRLVPRLTLIGPRNTRVMEGPALGLMIDTRLPTGSREDYQGEGFRFEPKVAFDYGFPAGLRVGAALGYMVRTDPGEIANVEASSGLTWSVAGSIPIVPVVRAVAELGGSALLGADDQGTEEAPLETLLGLRIQPHHQIMVQAGAGIGLVRGIGTPDYRVFAGLTFSPEGPPDRDVDGVTDANDACPDLYGDQPDGCPEPDRDGDGVCDPWVDEAGMHAHYAGRCTGVDACPDVPGERADGCPNPDRDGDRVCDPWVAEAGMSEHFAAECLAIDKCPDLFGDREDGCPNPDPDGDGVCSPFVAELGLGEYFANICERVDACPEEYGEQEDGCPLVTVTCTAIEISNRVHFATNSDVIEERSYPLLDAVADVLSEAPWIRLVRIEGHTDNTASAAYNLELSQRRAASVRTYLIEHGIEPDRLQAEGYGLTRPVADNDSEEGRAQNRRVEFVIVEQEDCPEQSVPQ